MNEIKKTGTIKRTRNKWNKNETKRTLNILDDEKNNILEKLDVNLTTLKLKSIFWGKSHDFEKERELRLRAKGK